MKYIPIGSITILINVSSSQNKLINEKLMRHFESTFESDIKNELSKYQLGVEFYVNAESKRGCVIETISIGIILGASYKFIKDYDKLRNNLKLIAEDLKNARLKLSGKKNKKLDSLKVEKIEIIKGNSKSNIPLVIEKKTSKETITLSNHKIAIMREDIKETISISDIEKLNENNSK